MMSQLSSIKSVYTHNHHQMNIYIIFFASLALCQHEYYTEYTVMVAKTTSNIEVQLFPAIVGASATETPIPTPVLTGILTVVTTWLTPDVAITKNGSATTEPIEMAMENTMVGNTTIYLPSQGNGGGRVVVGLGVLVPLVILVL